MGVMRLVPALGFSGLLGLLVLVPFTPVYATCCGCNMSCPQRGCTCCCCYSPCAMEDSEKDVTYNAIFSERPLEIRGMPENRALIASEPAVNNVPVKVRYVSSGSRGRLDTIPVGDLKFQCEHLKRLSEMLSEYQGRY